MVWHQILVSLYLVVNFRKIIKLWQVILIGQVLNIKRGKADKQRSAIFSKLSREITVAAKLGDKNPDMNSRLRSAIQAARSANMPKDNIERAIDKSSIAADSNFENIRYEGFGPAKTAIVVITLTDNKNRTASNIRTIFQKHGGGSWYTRVCIT